jgi:hypothetical protein
MCRSRYGRVPLYFGGTKANGLQRTQRCNPRQRHADTAREASSIIRIGPGEEKEDDRRYAKEC